MSSHKISFFLDSSENLRALAKSARHIAQLQQVFEELAPLPWTQACRVKELRSGTLVFATDNASIATQLKQLAPRLLSAYQQRRMEVTSIRFEVQVRERTRTRASFKAQSLSIENIEHLERLAASLEDTPLKDAVATMARRQRLDRDQNGS